MSDMDLPLAVRMMQDGYLMEIDQLQTENAELRKERGALDHLTDVLNATNDGLIAENAKLRELVKDMWLYDYAGKFSTKREDVEHVAMVYQRMRELGIEVDE